MIDFDEINNSIDEEQIEEDFLIPEVILEDDQQNVLQDHLIVSIDTEYTEQVFISLQVYCIYKQCSFSFIVINDQFKHLFLKEGLDFVLKKEEGYYMLDDLYIFFDIFGPEKHLLLNYLMIMLEKKNILHFLNEKCIYIDLFMYYSLKDLTLAFGRNNMYTYYLGMENKFFMQSRNIKGVLFFDIDYKLIQYSFKIYIKDVVSLHPGGLKDLANSVGLQKLDVLDDYKEDMVQALVEKPKWFLLYSMNDAILLPSIFEKKIDTFNSILQIYKVPPEAYFNNSTFPLTIGTIVSQVWQKNVFFNIFNADKFFILATLKQGILNPMHPNYQNNLEYFEALGKINSLQNLMVYSQADPVIFNNMYNALTQKNVFLYKLTEYASVNFLMSEASNRNSVSLAYTTGGRTVNERPSEVTIDYGADVDIQSAYGSQLEKLIYPIGRPRKYVKSPNEKEEFTLGEFMDRYENKISDDLFKVVVSGTLSFSQDLIFSKVEPKSYKNKKIVYNQLNPEDLDLNVPFVLIRKEIINGFITSYNWQVIKKVATNQELKEFRSLKVQSAIYWLREDKVSTISELADCCLRDKGKYYFDQKLDCIIDTRTHKWYGYSLKNFISPLILKRKEIKKNKDSISKALEQSIKLVVNTTWGLLTSSYFELNNVLCSELVTNNIRTIIWLTSKALNTNLSITDGGPYSLMKVTFFKDLPNQKKPGFDVLSNYNKYRKHRSIEIKPLGGINWIEYFKKNTPPTQSPFVDLDTLAVQHVKSFWKKYDIAFDINLEHKFENCFIKASYMLKAHYAFKIFDFKTNMYSGIKYKIRGFKYDKNIEFQHPIYELLLFCLNNDDYLNMPFEIKNKGIYYQKKLIKLNAWRKSLINIEKNRKVSSFGENILPGDAVLLPFEFRLNNTHFYIDTYSIYKKRTRRSFRYNKVYLKNEVVKVKMILFEKYLNIDISAMLFYMDNDSL